MISLQKPVTKIRMMFVKKTFNYFILICLVQFILCSLNLNAQDANRRLLWDYMKKVEDIFFGQHDFLNLKAKLPQYKDFDKYRAHSLISQYHRIMEEKPRKALLYITPTIMNEKSAKAWQLKTKSKISKHEAEWQKAKRVALAKKQPTPPEPALVLDFPKFDELVINEKTLTAVLEYCHCLTAIGELARALEIANMLGEKYESYSRVLTSESIGDFLVIAKDYQRSMKIYTYGLKYLDSIVSEEWSPYDRMLQTRLKKRISRLKRIMEIDRYGAGYFAYRDAELQRHKGASLTAILAYKDIQQDYPESIYAEASECYSIKCLLTLARYGVSAADKSNIKSVQGKIKSLKTRLALAKKAVLPKVKLDKIIVQIKKLDDRLKFYNQKRQKQTLYDQASKRTEAFIKKEKFGLYRGECLFDLALYQLEDQLNIKDAFIYFDRGYKWFNEAQKSRDILKKFNIPGKAKAITAPPRAEKKLDGWNNNVVKVKIEAGKILNRKDCNWYIDAYMAKFSKMLSFCHFYNKDYTTALNYIKTYSTHDSLERELNNKEEPNSISRLLMAIDQKYFRAEKNELDLFNRRLQIAVLLGDFYYETENYAKCYEIRNRLYRNGYEKLSPNAASSANYRLSEVLFRQLKFEEAKALLEDFHKAKFDKTLMQPKGLIGLGNIHFMNNDNNSNEAAIKAYRKAAISAKGDDKDTALYYLAGAYRKSGKTAQAIKTYQLALKHNPKTIFGNLCKKYITQLQGNNDDSKK